MCRAPYEGKKYALAYCHSDISDVKTQCMNYNFFQRAKKPSSAGSSTVSCIIARFDIDRSSFSLPIPMSTMRSDAYKCCTWQGLEPSQKLGRVGTPSTSRHTPTDKQQRYKALVRFQTHEEACRAVRERQGGYLLNLPVTIRVLP